MHVYQWWRGAIALGLPVVPEADGRGRVICLGRSKPGPRTITVPLDKYDPPEVVDGRVYYAEPQRVGRNPPLWVLSDAVDPTYDVLICVRTQWLHHPQAVGESHPVRGKPTRIVSKQLRRKIGRGCAFWIDSLYVMHPGDELHITPEGDAKMIPWSLHLGQDGLHTTPLYPARMTGSRALASTA